MDKMRIRMLDFIFQKSRIIKYKLLSVNKVEGNMIVHAPVLTCGEGVIAVGKNVNLGVKTSPNFYTSYHYLEARQKKSKLLIGNDVYINNGAVFVAEKSTITIGDKVLIGYNCQIVDSDFHNINVLNRHDGSQNSKPVTIGENVFIGNNVTILKGVTIGENSVVANGSVVTKSFPKNVVIGGNPAIIIKHLHEF